MLSRSMVYAPSEHAGCSSGASKILKKRTKICSNWASTTRKREKNVRKHSKYALSEHGWCCYWAYADAEHGSGLMLSMSIRLVRAWFGFDDEHLLSYNSSPQSLLQAPPRGSSSELQSLPWCSRECTAGRSGSAHLHAQPLVLWCPGQASPFEAPSTS